MRRHRGSVSRAVALLVIGALVALLTSALGQVPARASVGQALATSGGRFEISHPATSEHGSWWANHAPGHGAVASGVHNPRHKRDIPARSVHRVKIKLHKAVRKARSRVRAKGHVLRFGATPMVAVAAEPSRRSGVASGRALGQRDRRSLRQLVLGPSLSRDPPSTHLVTLL